MTNNYTGLIILFSLILIANVFFDSIFIKLIIMLFGFFICVSFNLISHICLECDVNKIVS